MKVVSGEVLQDGESLQRVTGYFRRVFLKGSLSRSGFVECIHLDTVDKQIAADKGFKLDIVCWQDHSASQRDSARFGVGATCSEVIA